MVSAETVLRNTGTIARHFSIPEDRFFVQHITLMDKEHTSSVSFKRMYKQIRLPNDKRRKKLVLGLVKSDGANHVKIMAKLSAKKITCTLMKTEKTIVMCSEEVVVK